MKTIFVPCASRMDVLPAVKKALTLFEDYEKIGIVSTPQHLCTLDKVSAFLSSKGKKPVVCGQILGCSQGKALAEEKNVEAYLYIGSGMFHPLGLSVKTAKPVIAANPYSGLAEAVSPDRLSEWKKKQKARLARAAGASVFGLLVSTKSGQENLALALKLKKKLEGSGKKAFLFSGTEIHPDRLVGYAVDAWVNTACPRIAEDFFDKPVLNPEELEVLL